MSNTNNLRPLSVRILEIISEHYGEPHPGAQETELSAAIAKLIGVAASQKSARELRAHEESFWQRLRHAPTATPKKEAH